ENFLINQETTDCIIAAIDDLPKNMQETAILYLIEKLPLDTIAKHLNCPTGTIRSRTFRIRKHISKFLADLEQTQQK
ncbi:MAG: RNA polymerase sigma factor RpoE, partial [Lentisphaerae bacterium]|nr:RNA polymerase sigma factor RpoE [Lentisphaerota bacterium]